MILETTSNGMSVLAQSLSDLTAVVEEEGDETFDSDGESTASGNREMKK
jgi:hypothetical protein